MSEIIAINSFQSWILASRPKTLGAVFCPVMIGTSIACAHGVFSPLVFAVTLLCAFLLQILANLINDYGDFIRGADALGRLGPKRAMQEGLLTKEIMFKGISLVVLLIVLLGSFLIFRGGIAIFWVGIFSLSLCAWYTLGPKPLAYLGFSEIFIFIVFGPLIVLGSFYIQTLSLSYEAAFASLTPGFLSCSLMLANNLRDMNQDKKCQKFTMAVRMGEQFSRITIIVLLVLSALGPVILTAFFGYSPLLLFSCLALVDPLRYVSMILHDPISARFNLIFAAAGKSLYLIGVLMTLGIIYAP